MPSMNELGALLDAGTLGELIAQKWNGKNKPFNGQRKDDESIIEFESHAAVPDAESIGALLLNFLELKGFLTTNTTRDYSVYFSMRIQCVDERVRQANFMATPHASIAPGKSNTVRLTTTWIPHRSGWKS